MSFIICDTDFLIKASTEPLPELAEFLAASGYQLATIPRIRSELEGLSKSEKIATARKARTALRSLSNKVKVLENNTGSSRKAEADSLLIELAANSKDQVVIATLDRSILSILENRRLSYLTLRKDRPYFRTFESATYLLKDRPK
jgi:rRNA-processing protein FCF1